MYLGCPIFWDPMPFSSSSKSYWWHAANSAINACQHLHYFSWVSSPLIPLLLLGVRSHISHLQIFGPNQQCPNLFIKKKSTNKLHLSWRLNHLQVGVTCPWALFWSSSVKPVIVASDQGFRFHVALEKMVNRDLLGDKKGHSWKHLDFVGHFQPCDFDDLFRWGLMPC